MSVNLFPSIRVQERATEKRWADKHKWYPMTVSLSNRSIIVTLKALRHRNFDARATPYYLSITVTTKKEHARHIGPITMTYRWSIIGNASNRTFCFANAQRACQKRTVSPKPKCSSLTVNGQNELVFSELVRDIRISRNVDFEDLTAGSFLLSLPVQY